MTVHAWASTNLATSAVAYGGTTAEYLKLSDGRLDRLAVFTGGFSSPNYLAILSWTFAAPVAVSAVAVLNHKIASLTNPSITILAGDSTISLSAVTGVNPASGDTFVSINAPPTKLVWAVQLAHQSAVPGTLFQLGEVFMSTGMTTLSRATTYGRQDGEEFYTNSVTSRTGEVRSVYLGGPLRTKTLPFADLRAAELAELQAMWRAGKGGATPILWADEYAVGGTSAAAQSCLYGRLQPSWGWVERDFGLFDVSSMELRSLAREVGA